MRIIYIATYPPRRQKHSETGGVASYTKNLVTNMPLGVADDVFVVCDKINGQSEQYEEDGIQVIRRFDKNFKFVTQILKAVKEIKPDLVHIQQELSVFGNVVTAYLLQWLLLLFRRRYPTVITLHGVVSLGSVDSKFVRSNNANLPAWMVKSALYLIYKPLTIWATRIVVHENYFKSILVREYKVAADKISVIYHGVEDIQSVDEASARQTLGITPDRHVVLFMGYATGYKGIELLLEGFSKYAEIDPRAYLVVGSGKHPKLKDNQQYLAYYQQLETRAASLISRDQYRWAGFIPEDQIVTYYSASDVSVFPYTVAMSSSGPMAMAMACAKPFLASEAFGAVFSDQEIIFDRSPDGLLAKLTNFFSAQPIFEEKAKGYKSDRLYGNSGKKTHDLYIGLLHGK